MIRKSLVRRTVVFASAALTLISVLPAAAQTGRATVTPSPQPPAAATRVASRTPLPTDIPATAVPTTAPTHTPTDEPTATPTATFTPVPDGIFSTEAVALYDAPFDLAAMVGELPAGDLIEPAAISADGRWLRVERPLGAGGWFAVNLRTMTVSGSLADLPVEVVEPTPTPTNTPTTVPTNTPTAVPTNTPTLTPSLTPTNTPTSTFTPTLTPTNTPTDVPTNTPTNTPTPTETPTNTPAPAAQIPAEVRNNCAANAARIVVLPPGVQELWVRDVPAGNNIVIRLANNNPVTAQGGIRFARGQWWCQVSVNLTGQVGWVESGAIR